MISRTLVRALTVLTLVGFSGALIGCGGESATPAPKADEKKAEAKPADEKK